MFVGDGCNTHLSKETSDVLSQNNVIIQLLPPYSSHLLHPLDVLMFGPLKNMEVGLDDISDDKLVNSINVIINKIQRTFTSINIVKSFEKSWIYHRSSGTKVDRRS